MTANNKERMIIDVLLQELKDARKSIDIACGISEEKTVKHYLVHRVDKMDELIAATEKELQSE